MERNITLEVITDGNIEACRDLCNELMAFQKSQATLAPEAFDAMNFDTRMKKGFESALESQVVVVKDNGVPVGYVFSTIDMVEGETNAIPDWAPVKDPSTAQGFYPDWVQFPQKIGLLNNLYIRDDYRDLKLGSQLFNMSIDWLESHADVDLIFIYISNGNDAALNFYLNRGFTYSHEVFGGFIKAVYKEKKTWVF
ncbi:GNAT family N-acetyltransferase [Tumebacillus flagellatus]|uniref:GCN5 family acetyltransferase n=1 Tax=Tumebacillus flagellatus TaxID=1157490 RepID=A0A074MFB6_9BACL|nr:GNAT family N-acetyltransferase [Tumebacillus flagellatus]KEO84477.1 GCN5 family acetyltransferase [Tumebacillus flagellatus]